LGSISLKILADAPISIAIGFAHLVAFYISQSVLDLPFRNPPPDSGFGNS
jgi:hypothetical protein